jgi:hypothetical protein
MSVDPTKSNPLPGSGAGRIQRPTPQSPDARRDPETPGGVPSTSADAVELSEAARELLQKIGLDGPPLADLSPERMKEIAARLRSGFYDRPDVVDEVLRRLQKDL